MNIMETKRIVAKPHHRDIPFLQVTSESESRLWMSASCLCTHLQMERQDRRSQNRAPKMKRQGILAISVDGGRLTAVDMRADYREMACVILAVKSATTCVIRRGQSSVLCRWLGLAVALAG